MKAVHHDETVLAAERTLRHIHDLRACQAFDEYFLRRLRERREKLALQVLDEDKLTPEEREKIRQRYLEARDLLKLVEQDEAGAKNVLGQNAGRRA